jgi:hypothetical protein
MVDSNHGRCAASVGVCRGSHTKKKVKNWREAERITTSVSQLGTICNRPAHKLPRRSETWLGGLRGSMRQHNTPRCLWLLQKAEHQGTTGKTSPLIGHPIEVCQLIQNCNGCQAQHRRTAEPVPSHETIYSRREQDNGSEPLEPGSPCQQNIGPFHLNTATFFGSIVALPACRMRRRSK